jgi:DNA-binding XRE family transcriptional regulator
VPAREESKNGETENDGRESEKSWSLCLLERRQMFGLSQTQLAVLAGVTQQAVSAIETGAANPRITTARKIALALSTDLETLFPSSSAPSVPLR